MLPCCAFIPEISQADSMNSPFAWKNPENLPAQKDDFSHLPLLEKYNIPFVFDIHTHFFPEVVMRAIWKWFDKVNWGISYRTSEEKRLESLNNNKIKYFTTLQYAHRPKMAEWLNQWAYENHRNTEGAILFGTFYPEKNCAEYVKKAVEKYGIKGFKLHCEVSKLNLNNIELKDTFIYLEKLNLPILIHTGTAPLPGEFTGLKYFRPFMDSFPNLKVIVAHMGAHEIEGYANLLDTYPNLGLDTTMVFVDFFATGSFQYNFLYLLDKYQDKIYFGSDFPNIPYSLSHPISEILNSNISLEAKRKIMYQNGLRLFGIST